MRNNYDTTLGTDRQRGINHIPYLTYLTEVNDYIAQTAQARGFYLADVWTLMNGPNHDQAIDPSELVDSAHPTDATSAKIAQVYVAQGVTPICST